MNQFELMIEAYQEARRDREETSYPAREGLEWEPERYDTPVDVVFRRTRWNNR